MKHGRKHHVGVYASDADWQRARVLCIERATELGELLGDLLRKELATAARRKTASSKRRSAAARSLRDELRKADLAPQAGKSAAGREKAAQSAGDPSPRPRRRSRPTRLEE